MDVVDDAARLLREGRSRWELRNHIPILNEHVARFVGPATPRCRLRRRDREVRTRDGAMLRGAVRGPRSITVGEALHLTRQRDLFVRRIEAALQERLVDRARFVVPAEPQQHASDAEARDTLFLPSVRGPKCTLERSECLLWTVCERVGAPGLDQRRETRRRGVGEDGRGQGERDQRSREHGGMKTPMNHHFVPQVLRSPNISEKYPVIVAGCNNMQ